MNRSRRGKLVATVGVVGIGIITIMVAMHFGVTSGAPFPAYMAPANQADVSHTRGPVGSLLLTPSGLAITLMSVEKGNTRWYFHVKISNSADTPGMALGKKLVITGSMHADQSQLDHQFVIPVMDPAATYGGFLEWRPAGIPSSSEVAAHPALPMAVAAHGTSDGWLAMDITNIGMAAPSQLVYTFDPVSGKKCANPAQASTCSPETLYSVLTWDLG